MDSRTRLTTSPRSHQWLIEVGRGGCLQPPDGNGNTQTEWGWRALEGLAGCVVRRPVFLSGWVTFSFNPAAVWESMPWMSCVFFWGKASAGLRLRLVGSAREVKA